MSSFISDVLKEKLAEQFNHLHDTFARDIIVYKEAKKVVISTDPNYNYIYNETGSGTNIQNIPQKQTFKARILYGTGGEIEYMSKTKVGVYRRVRIKLKKEDYLQIQGVKRIELDGRMFLIDSDARPHGLFNVDFYTIHLNPVEST